MPYKSVAAIVLSALILAPISMIWFDLPVRAATLGAAPWLWERVTLLGTSGWMLGATLGLGVLFAILRQARRRNAALFVFGAVALTGIAVQILKAAFGRARPPLFDQVGHLDFQHFGFVSQHSSLPSGHATTAFAFAVALGFLHPVLRAPAALFAILVTFSRLPVGAHYLSDIIAGSALGASGAISLAGYLTQRGVRFDLKK